MPFLVIAEPYWRYGSKRIRAINIEADRRAADVIKLRREQPAAYFLYPGQLYLERFPKSDHFDDPAEEREVSGRAGAGCSIAKAQFYLQFHKALLGAADRSGPSFEDLLSAANVGFWKAFDRYDLNSSDRFWCFASQSVSGAVADCR